MANELMCYVLSSKEGRFRSGAGICVFVVVGGEDVVAGLASLVGMMIELWSEASVCCDRCPEQPSTFIS
jgi:hypothetical protein